MLISTHSRFNVDRALEIGAHLAYATLVLVSLCRIYAFFLPFQSPPLPVLPLSKAPVFCHDSIGMGPLSLNPSYSFLSVPHLAKEIMVLAKNTRPDVKAEKARLVLSLKSSGCQRETFSGETLFLNCETKENDRCTCFSFSETPTLISIKPLIWGTKEVMIEVKRRAEEGSQEEKVHFVIEGKGHGGSLHQDALNNGAASFFADAKWWGQDILIEKYGGEGYSSVKRKHKIELQDGSVCFVQPGDYISKNQGRWCAGGLQTVDTTSALGAIKAISSREMEIETWDETGFHNVSVKLHMQTAPKLALKTENLPTAMRLRTNSQVSCALGKRRVLLKEGEWLLKTASGWRILKGADDIEDFIHHRLKGELLIFESVEKQEGKIFFKGCLFDEMRTQSLPVCLPIALDKKTTRPQKKSKRAQ